MSVFQRMQFADYTRTYFDLWGGTKFGMDTHALSRSIDRYYPFMSFDLLTSNIKDIYCHGGEELEDLVMALPLGTKFVVFDERINMAIFTAIDFNETTRLNEVFIHSIYVLKPWETTVYCEAENTGLFKLRADGTVEENPPELHLKEKSPLEKP